MEFKNIKVIKRDDRIKEFEFGRIIMAINMAYTDIYDEDQINGIEVSGCCGYSGVMGNDPKTLDWVCPNCGNRDQQTLSVVRRTCGYLGETEWTDGRKLDILNRVKHL